MGVAVPSPSPAVALLDALAAAGVPVPQADSRGLSVMELDRAALVEAEGQLDEVGLGVRPGMARSS